MEKVMIRNVFVLLAISLLVGWNSLSAQNAGDNQRFNLAVYATGLQDGNALSASVKSVAQNTASTNLQKGGNYQLIERSNEFLKQIEEEQRIQQSGDVADDQIAEVGASYGAQKICVINVIIEGDYLYVAARIVDVTTKTSYESAEADVKGYQGIAQIRPTVADAINQILKASAVPRKAVKSAEAMNSNTQISHDNAAHQSDNFTVAEIKKAKKEADDDIKAYRKRLMKEKGGFLEVNSLAYIEYRKWKRNMVSGSMLVSLLPFPTVICMALAIDNPSWYWILASGLTLAGFTTGVVQLCTMNKHLKKSYNYYLNGDSQTATLQFYPYYGGNNTFGVGLTLRF